MRLLQSRATGYFDISRYRTIKASMIMVDFPTTGWQYRAVIYHDRAKVSFYFAWIPLRQPSIAVNTVTGFAASILIRMPTLGSYFSHYRLIIMAVTDIIGQEGQYYRQRDRYQPRWYRPGYRGQWSSSRWRRHQSLPHTAQLRVSQPVGHWLRPTASGWGSATDIGQPVSW